MAARVCVSRSSQIGQSNSARGSHRVTGHGETQRDLRGRPVGSGLCLAVWSVGAGTGLVVGSEGAELGLAVGSEGAELGVVVGSMGAVGAELGLVVGSVGVELGLAVGNGLGLVVGTVGAGLGPAERLHSVRSRVSAPASYNSFSICCARTLSTSVNTSTGASKFFAALREMDKAPRRALMTLIFLWPKFRRRTVYSQLPPLGAGQGVGAADGGPNSSEMAATNSSISAWHSDCTWTMTCSCVSEASNRRRVGPPWNSLPGVARSRLRPVPNTSFNCCTNCSSPYTVNDLMCAMKSVVVMVIIRLRRGTGVMGSLSCTCCSTVAKDRGMSCNASVSSPVASDRTAWGIINNTSKTGRMGGLCLVNSTGGSLRCNLVPNDRCRVRLFMRKCCTPPPPCPIRCQRRQERAFGAYIWTFPVVVVVVAFSWLWKNHCGLNLTHGRRSVPPAIKTVTTPNQAVWTMTFCPSPEYEALVGLLNGTPSVVIDGFRYPRLFCVCVCDSKEEENCQNLDGTRAIPFVGFSSSDIIADVQINGISVSVVVGNS
jgi:hypothetical protein